MDENHHSQMNILQFYLEICAGELRKTNVTEDKFKSSLMAVGSACSLSPSETSLKSINFGAPQNRAAYIYKFHPCLTWSLENYIKRAMTETCEVSTIVKKLLSDSNVKLCCIGGEVGADFIGFLLAISGFTNKPAFKSVSVIAKCADWRQTFNNILANLKSGILNPVHEVILGNKFVSTLEGCDFSKNLSSKILHKIKEANIFLITKFFPLTSADGTPLEKTIKDILSAINPGALVFFIDYSNGFSTMLHTVQCTNQNILFGPLQEQYSFPQLKEVFKGLFGCFPQVSSRTYFMVWKKVLYNCVASSDLMLTSAQNLSELNQSSTTSKICSNIIVSDSSHDSNDHEVSPHIGTSDVLLFSNSSVSVNGLPNEHMFSYTNDSSSITVGDSATPHKLAYGFNFSNNKKESVGAVSELGNNCQNDKNVIKKSQKNVLCTTTGNEKVPCCTSASSSADGSDSSGTDYVKFAKCFPSNEISSAAEIALKPQYEDNSCPISSTNKVNDEQVADTAKVSRRRRRGGRKSQAKGKAQNENHDHGVKQNGSVVSQVPPAKVSTPSFCKGFSETVQDLYVKRNSCSNATKLFHNVGTQKMTSESAIGDKQGVVSVPVDCAQDTTSKLSDGCFFNRKALSIVHKENAYMERLRAVQAADSRTVACNTANPLFEKFGIKDDKQKWRPIKLNKFTQTPTEESVQKLADTTEKCVFQLTQRIDTLASIVEEIVSSQQQEHCNFTNCCRCVPRSDAYFGIRNTSPSLVLPIHNLTENQVSQMLSILLSQSLNSKNHSQ